MTAKFSIMQTDSSTAARLKKLSKKVGTENRTAEERRKLFARLKTQHFEELKGEFPPVIIPGLCYMGRRWMLTGKPISGKGVVLEQTSFCVATKADWFGIQLPTQGPVLHVDFELMEPQLKERIGLMIEHFARGDNNRKKELTEAVNQNLFLISAAGRQALISEPDFIDEIIDRAIEHKVILATFDPFWRVLPSEMDPKLMHPFLEKLDEFNRRTKATLFYTQHQTKGDQSGKDIVERFSGRFDLARDAATMTSMLEVADDCYQLETRTNDFARPADLYVRLEYPVFVRLTDLEIDQLQAKKLNREISPEDLLPLLPNKMFPSESGPDYLLLAELHNQAKATLGWGRDKTDAQLKILLHRHLVESFELPKEEGGRGRGNKAIRRANHT